MKSVSTKGGTAAGLPLAWIMADEAVAENNVYTAITLYHKAVASCYHIGQHIFFIDPEQKQQNQEKARRSYKKALELYPEERRPKRIEIPFKGAKRGSSGLSVLEGEKE